MIDARTFLLEDPEIATAIDDGDTLDANILAKMEAFAWAYFTRTDLRWLLLDHPDRAEVTRACLHFLGDAAQEWWAAREQEKKAEQLSESLKLSESSQT